MDRSGDPIQPASVAFQTERPATFLDRCARLWKWIRRVPRQLLGISPFDGDCQPSRVPLFKRGRRAWPFPHPWNYHQPIEILEAYFFGADSEGGPGRHNRYLEVPGFAPILVTRDPGIIRAIASETGDFAGKFDRDSMPSTGIARATGKDTLLFSNGAFWKLQRKLAASPFGKTALFQAEVFREFAATLRSTVTHRLQVLEDYLTNTRRAFARVQLEPEIKPIMLELLTSNFFGAKITYEELRQRYVPAMESVIAHIVRDTVLNRLDVSFVKLPAFTSAMARLKADYDCFDELTNRVLTARRDQAGLWKLFKSDAPDEDLRSNLKVFLAGALEATTSFATWAISHLARNQTAQEAVCQEVRDIRDYTPDNLQSAKYLSTVLEETLRLTPSLYFLPRRASVDTWVETADGRRMFIPDGAHILLDVWHANRHEDNWGVSVSGYPANEFVPERWTQIATQGRGSKDVLHFGFGHGPRVCPGKHLGQLEVALVVGAFVQLFKFKAVHQENPARAGVSTKPADGTLVELQLR